MRLHRSVTALSLVTLGVALGCGATKDNSGNDNCLVNCNDGGNNDGGFNFDVGGDGFDLDAFTFQDISIDPSNATIYIDTSTATPTPATQTYTAKLNLQGGGTKDVTTEIVLTLDDPALGSFKGNVFTSVTSLPGVPAGKVGGITTVVHGNAESKAGTANLTIVQLRKGGDHRDFYFVVPYKSAPSPDHDVLKFGTNIKQVDVAFSVDTTGSMGGSISALTASISGTLMPGLTAAIPSVGLADVDFKDSHDGDSWTAKVNQVVTTDVSLAKAGVTAMSAGGGGDEPEADMQSMYHIVTGDSIASDPAIAKHTPAPGTSGGVDFRAGSLPVVVNVTDAHWHDSDDPNTEINTNADVGMKGLIGAFKAANAKFVGVTDMHYESFEDTPILLIDQPQRFADGTGSYIDPSAFGGACGAGQCCTGQSGAAEAPSGPGGTCRLSFKISDGAGLGDSVIKAIQAISVGSVFDVTAVASNDPSNATGSDGKPVDATKFIKDLRAMDEGSTPDGCPAHAAKDTDGDGIKDTFTAVVVGTPVCFEIDPQENVTVPPKPAAQFFNAFIDVLGMPGSVKLDHRVVLFLVPPKDPAAK